MRSSNQVVNTGNTKIMINIASSGIAIIDYISIPHPRKIYRIAINEARIAG